MPARDLEVVSHTTPRGLGLPLLFWGRGRLGGSVFEVHAFRESRQRCSCIEDDPVPFGRLPELCRGWQASWTVLRVSRHGRKWNRSVRPAGWLAPAASLRARMRIGSAACGVFQGQSPRHMREHARARALSDDLAGQEGLIFLRTARHHLNYTLSHSRHPLVLRRASVVQRPRAARPPEAGGAYRGASYPTARRPPTGKSAQPQALARVSLAPADECCESSPVVWLGSASAAP